MSASERRARRDRDTLRAFAREVTDSFLEYRTPDLGQMQDLLMAHGLIVEVQATESCGLGCTCYSMGSFPTTCLRPSRVLTGNRDDPEASEPRPLSEREDRGREERDG